MCECWVPRGLQYLPETRECWEGLGGAAAWYLKKVVYIFLPAPHPTGVTNAPG